MGHLERGWGIWRGGGASGEGVGHLERGVGHLEGGGE